MKDYTKLLESFKKEEINLIEKYVTEVAMASGVRTTFSQINEKNKILILDAIIDELSTVFGPLGGLFVEGITHNGQVEGDTSIEMIKSSDGYNFMNKLVMFPKHASLILDAIKKRARYISEYNDETSRDGTTSVGILGSTISKRMLLESLNSDTVKKTPSTVINKAFESFVLAGTQLIDESKVSIKDEKGAITLKGKELLEKVIRTTTDNENVICAPFTAIANELFDKGTINIDDIRAFNPIRRIGANKLDLQLLSGIKVACTNIDENTTVTLTESAGTLLILDGFIDDKLVNTYKSELEAYVAKMSTLLSSVSKEGGYVELVCLVTRTSTLIRALYADLMKRYKNVKFVTLLDNDTNKPMFIDFCKINKEAYVDLNGWVHYNNTNKTPITLSTILPKFDTKVMTNSVKCDIIKELKTKVVTTEFKGGKTIEDNPEGAYVYSLSKEYSFFTENLINVFNFDGEAMLINSNVEVVQERIEVIRNELKEVVAKLSQLDGSYTPARKRLDSFKTSTLKAVLYTSTDDEKVRLGDLYEDCMGVFESTIKHGVLAGSNTFIPSKMGKLEKTAKVVFLNKLRSDLGVEADSDLEDKYLEFFDKLANSIFSGYVDTHAVLTGSLDTTVEVISTLTESRDWDKEEANILNYNIINQRYQDDIVEPARTTADCFLCSLAICKDMLSIKNIYIGDLKYDIDACRDFNVGRHHTRNTDILLELKK